MLKVHNLENARREYDCFGRELRSACVVAIVGVVRDQDLLHTNLEVFLFVAARAADFKHDLFYVSSAASEFKQLGAGFVDGLDDVERAEIDTFSRCTAGR